MVFTHSFRANYVVCSPTKVVLNFWLDCTDRQFDAHAMLLRRKKDYQKLDFNNICALNKFSFDGQNRNGDTDAFV